MGACKKNAGPHGTLVFLDETGFSEGSVIRRTWARRGETPVLRTRQGSWRRMSALGALAYQAAKGKARVFVSFVRHSFRTDDVLRFVKHLSRHLRGRVTLVWDNLAAHKSRKLKDWVAHHPRFRLVYLPAYAPELNPVEGLWSWLKTNHLGNVCADTLDPLVALAREGTKTARRRQPLLWSFLGKAGLSL